MNNKLHNIPSPNKEIKETWIDSSKQFRKEEIPEDLILSQDGKLGKEDAYQNIEILLAIGWVLLIYFFY